ncbi:MAG TPA: MFS transporter [Acetobacteraceae bacterium]|nr:MFS transporter [Acetobacteraceae bacterium]
MATPRIHRGLDWLNFFVADLQTGFGPFIAVFLTTHKWTQLDIGLALSVGSIASMAAQVPAGVLVDAMPNKRLAAGIALAGICTAAMLIGFLPQLAPVLLAQALHGMASCMLNPSIAALTLGLVASSAVAARFGRNAGFAAAGAAAGAMLMGAVGSFLSNRAVLFLAAALCLPALWMLRHLNHSGRSAAAPAEEPAMILVPPDEPWRGVLADRRLLAYLGCIVLFHFANAAMLPLAAIEVTKRVGNDANLVIAACILVPQIIVALLAARVGSWAQLWGRKPILLLGFCALPARALLLAYVDHPALIVVVQALDGLGASAFGVMTPLIAADLSGNGGRFNLRMGLFGLAVGLGATFSTSVAGWAASTYTSDTAFHLLAVAGAAAVLMVAFAMPETRPRQTAPARPATSAA